MIKMVDEGLLSSLTQDGLDGFLSLELPDESWDGEPSSVRYFVAQNNRLVDRTRNERLLYRMF
jgi:hypothetical protein